MAWVQLFPTNNTLISQSVNQIQQNWLFIQNNINTDHFFNTGAPSEGHHRFVHLVTQGADPAVILTGVVYQKNTFTGNPRLFYNTVSGPEQISTSVQLIHVNCPAGAPGVDVPVIDLVGFHNFRGTIWVVDEANPGNRASALLMFDAAPHVDQVAVHGAITNINGAGTVINIRKGAAAMLVNVMIIKAEF